MCRRGSFEAGTPTGATPRSSRMRQWARRPASCTMRHRPCSRCPLPSPCHFDKAPLICRASCSVLLRLMLRNAPQRSALHCRTSCGHLRRRNSQGAADMQGIVEGKLIQLKGMVGIWPAATVGDDIQVRVVYATHCLTVSLASPSRSGS